MQTHSSVMCLTHFVNSCRGASPQSSHRRWCQSHPPEQPALSMVLWLLLYRMLPHFSQVMFRWFIVGCGWRLVVDFRDVPRIVNHQLDTGWLSFWSPRHLLNFCMIHRDSSHSCPWFLYIDPGFSSHHQLHILSQRHPTFRMLCCKAS